jgi:hypothetical protein
MNTQIVADGRGNHIEKSFVMSEISNNNTFSIIPGVNVIRSWLFKIRKK